jgi:hypothetical protein
MKIVKIKKRKKGKPLSKTQAKYRFNPSYQENAKETARDNYRKSRGKNFELSGNTVLRSLEFVDTCAEKLPCFSSDTGKSVGIKPVLRLTELAKLLDTTYQTVWRWSSDTEQLPEPALYETTTGRDRPVYHLEECKVMIQHIGNHLKDYAYYRKNHTKVRDLIFADIQHLRETNFGENTHGDQEKAKTSRTRRSIKRK